METEIKISNVYDVESAWDEVLSNEDTFEEDQSGFEFASTSIEYIETADGYYPLHANPEIATEDAARLVLSVEQQDAVLVALAGGTATVEILTPFGIDTTEVWSIQTFTASGEGCFVLTATTEERDIVLLEQDNEDANISIVEMAYVDSGSGSGGDVVITVPLERHMDTNSEPVLVQVIIDDDVTRQEIVSEEIIINTPPTAVVETQTTQYQLKDEPTEQIVIAIDASAETKKPKESVDDGEEIESEAPHTEASPALASEKSEQGQWSKVSKEPMVLEVAESMTSEVLAAEPDSEEYEVELDILTEEHEPVVSENSSADTAPASNLVETTLPDIKADVQQPVEHFHAEEPHIIIHDVEQKPRSVNVEYEQEIVVAAVPIITDQETLHQTEISENIGSTTDYEEASRGSNSEAASETVPADSSVHRVETYESDAPRPTREVHVRPLSSWEAFDFEPTYDTKPARRLFDAVDDDIVISFETSRRNMGRRQARLTRRRVV